MRKLGRLRQNVAASLAIVLAAAPVSPMQSFAQTTQNYAVGEIKLDPQIHYQTLEGWGTSLCWWGNVIGSDTELDSDGDGKTNREEIAELAFSPEYLNLNIVRYNVGGGDKADSTIKRVEGRVPGWSEDMFGNVEGTGPFLEGEFYEKEASQMNDSGQIWMLEKANAWRAETGDVMNEVFSNSPPYYMTKSGSSTGGTNGDKENLKSDYYDDFAQYLVRATKWLDKNLKEKYGTGIQYLEPLNEPDTDYWMEGSTKQEGCIFRWGESQNRAYEEVRKALDGAGMSDVKLTGTDETSLEKAIWSYNQLSPEVRSDLAVISAHTYSGNNEQRNELRKIAASYDKGLWMSEVTRGGGTHSKSSHDSMNESCTKWQSEGIMADLKHMKPTAWIAWLVADSEYECIQTGENWGLLHYVFEKNGPVKDYHTNLINGDGTKKEDVPDYGYYAVTKQFYTMMQYSKYLKAGYTMVEIGDDNMCAAISPDKKELVIVAQNYGSGTRNTSVDIHKLPFASQVKLYRTSDSESCEEVKAQMTGGLLQMTLPQNSVSTYVITAEENAPLYQIEGYKKLVDCDVQVTADTIQAGASSMDKFTYDGEWQDGTWTQEKWTTNQDSSVTFTFTGTGAAIYGKKSPNGANLTVKTDENDAVIISAGAAREERRSLLYATPELKYGTHYVTIDMKGEQTAQAPEIVVEYAEIINGSLEDAQVEPLPEYVTVNGLAPNLPLTVENQQGGDALPVDWKIDSETFRVEDYTTVTVTGQLVGTSAQITADVLVVPENLQFFIDCNNTESVLYEKLNSVLTLKNDVADQKKAENEWGYEEEYGAHKNESNHDYLDWGWYAGKDQSIAYTIPLKAGTYSLSFGFKEWWAEYDQYRPMTVTASFLTAGVPQKETLCNVTITDEEPLETGKGTLVLPEDSDVTFTVAKTGNQDPVLSYLAIAQEVDHSTLLAALGQAYALDRTNCDASLLEKLDTGVEKGRQLLLAQETTAEASSLAAKEIATILSELNSNSEFTEEELKANDYVLYLANCGTPDATVVPQGHRKGLMQSTVNQLYEKDAGTGKKWGYAANDQYSRIAVSGDDETDAFESFMYMDSDAAFDKEKSGLRYTFTLPSADYQVVLGFKNPWSDRKVDVKLEGESIQKNLNLKSEEAVERTYVTSVADGELNVMVHNPNRTSQYEDPLLSYIIVKAIPECTIDYLTQTRNSYDEIAQEGTWYETDYQAYQKTSESVGELIQSGTGDETLIRTAYRDLCNAFARLQERIPYNTISGVKGETLYDTNGVQIQAHGGQIQQLEVDGVTKYYWIGEDKTYDYRPVGGIHVYSSEDLYNWTDEGVVLKTMESMEEFESDPYFKELYKDYTKEEKEKIFIDLDKNNCVIERPKMIYNEENDQYVIWFHADGRTPESDADYGKAKAGIAVSDSPAGPFKLLGSYKLNYHDDPGADHGYDEWGGRGSVRDMNLFVDDDGTGYVIYSSEGNKTTFVSRLNEDYTDLAVPREEAVEGIDFTRNFIGWSREAPAMFQYNDKYYMINSGCTGWDPNPAQYAVADHPMGPWTAMGDPCEGQDSHTTFYTQSTCVFPVDAENGKYIYMGDRWNKGDLSESRYVWLPIEFMEGDRLVLKRYEDWNMEDLSGLGAARIITEIPEQFNSLHELKAALPNFIDVNIGGELQEDLEVVWDEIDTDKDFAGTYHAKGILKKTNKSVTHSADIVYTDTIYFFDCAAEDSEYLDVLEQAADGLRNEASDQSYSKEDSAGYLGERGEDFDKHDGQDLYSNGWWAKENKPVEYQFDLRPGSYSVVTGYQEWWNTTRDMKLSVSMADEGKTEVELAKQNITLNDTEKALTETLDFTVPGTGKELVPVRVRIEKTGKADPVLSFIGITSSEEQGEERVVISGRVTTEEAIGQDAIRVNLYEGDISLATPSEATPLDTTETNEEGEYSFSSLETGIYSVEVPKQKDYKRVLLIVEAKEDITNADVTIIKETPDIPPEETPGKLEIRIEKLPEKRRYLVGESLDLTGLEVFLHQDEEKRRLLDEEYEVSAFDSSTPGKRTITVTYTDKENSSQDTYRAEFEVTVYEEQTAPIIKIVKLPARRLYQLDEQIDLKGIEVRGLNIQDEPCIISEEELEVEYDFSQPGSVPVTIRYQFQSEDGEIELQDTFTVTVYESDFSSEPQVESIQIVNPPYRVVYGVDDTFTADGLQVEKTIVALASSSNATYRETILPEELEVECEDFDKPGKKKVTVAYYTTGEDGEEKRLEDSLTVTVTKSENLLTGDQLKAIQKKLEDQLKMGEFMTTKERQENFQQALEQAKECVENKSSMEDSDYKVLGTIEELLLQNFDNITTALWLDEGFTNVQVQGLALSADISSPDAQQMKLNIAKSDETLPANIRNITENSVAMDITLFREGDEIQPKLPLRISMKIPKQLEKNNLVIYYNHDGNWKTLVPVIRGDQMVFFINELSLYVVANTKEDIKPSNKDDNDESSSGPAYTIPGTWKQDAVGWWYQKTDGTYLSVSWARINGQWYYFNEQGYMVTGWLLDRGLWYYLNTDGSMAQSQWIQWKGAWYYLTWNGAMAVATQTPDGFRVGNDGIWVPLETPRI